MKLQHTIKSLLWSLLFVTSILSITSCDADNKKAFRLNGQWYGDFGMNYSYQYGGRTYTFDCYDTKIRFVSDNFYSSHGYGTQVDYYRDGPYEFLYYDFRWSIDDGVITIRYKWASDWDTEIYNYKLSMSHFRGYFRDSNVYFDLRSLSDYDWAISNSHYVQYGYGWDTYSGYNYYPYYAKGHQGTPNADGGKMREQADSAAYIPAPEEMHFGNRFVTKK